MSKPSLQGWGWVVIRIVDGPDLLLLRGWLDNFVCVGEREVVTLVYSHMFVPVPHWYVTGGAELLGLKCLVGDGDQVGKGVGSTARVTLTVYRRCR